MGDRPTPPPSWQYVLVWTPGPERSQVQLWAANRQGTRNLWDSWETTGFPETPSLHAVLHNLYVAAVDGQERSSHRG